MEWDGFPLFLLKLRIQSGKNFFSCLVGCGPTPTYSTGTGAGTGGGFWSGAFTGGILGYMLGNNRNNYYAPGYTSPYSTGWGYNTPRASRGWFSSGSGLGSGFGGGSTSTGTRTASGFGGTKRRWIYWYCPAINQLREQIWEWEWMRTWFQTVIQRLSSFLKKNYTSFIVSISCNPVKVVLWLYVLCNCHDKYYRFCSFWHVFSFQVSVL